MGPKKFLSGGQELSNIKTSRSASLARAPGAPPKAPGSTAGNNRFDTLVGAPEDAVKQAEIEAQDAAKRIMPLPSPLIDNGNADRASTGGASQAKARPALPRIINVARPLAPVSPSRAKAVGLSTAPPESKSTGPPSADPSPKKTRPAMQSIEEDRNTISAQFIVAEEAQPAAQPSPVPAGAAGAAEDLAVDIVPQGAAPSVAAPSVAAAAPSLEAILGQPSDVEQTPDGGLATMTSSFSLLEMMYRCPRVFDGPDGWIRKYRLTAFQPPLPAITYQQARDRLGEVVVAELCATGELYRFAEGEVDYVAGAAATACPHFFRFGWQGNGNDCLVALNEVSGDLGAKKAQFSNALAAMKGAIGALAPKALTAALCLGTFQALGDADLDADVGEMLRNVLQEVEFSLPGLRTKGTVDAEGMAVRRGSEPQIAREQATFMSNAVTSAFNAFKEAHKGAVSAAVDLLGSAAFATDLLVLVKSKQGVPLILQAAANTAWNAVLGLFQMSASLTAAVHAIATAVQARGPAKALPTQLALVEANTRWHAEVERLLYDRVCQPEGAGGGSF